MELYITELIIKKYEKFKFFTQKPNPLGLIIRIATQRMGLFEQKISRSLKRTDNSIEKAE